MIFNPLYFSETGNNQMLVAKPNKLSSNKYLFSDIVKVVMNNDREQKKILETDLDNIIKNGLPSIAGVENAATQIQHTELSESDNKKAKTDLADILPFDIAQLLINDDIKITEEPALSYISKEPLEGDLQKFINSLVGEEVLNQNITKDTGLFLHLEDSKSAVNIELNKDSSQNAAQDKVIVQTLVVPQKSKLISMFNHTENKENIVSSTKGIPLLNTSTINIENENIISDPKSLKPTLSVYSFKNSEKSNQTLISENKGTIKLEFTNSNQSASVGKNNFSLKVPLEKISFIPSELKNQNISAKEIANTNNDLKNISETLKSIDPTIKISEKDFSVSKITIVKKQDGLNKIIDEKLNIEDKKIDSSLRKISFTDQTKIQNTELKLIKNNILNAEKPQNTNSEKLHLIKPNEVLSESNKIIHEGNDPIEPNKELKNNFIKQTTNVKIEKSDLTLLKSDNKTEASAKNSIQQELENMQIEKSGLKNIKQNILLNEQKNSSSAENIINEKSKIENIALNNGKNDNGKDSTVKVENDNVSKVKSNSNQIDLSKKEIFEKESVKIIDTKNSLNQKDVSSQKIENNITDVNKELKTDSNELKNEPKKTQTEEITKTVVNSEEAVKSVVLEDAKKISVKVKGGVKTVTNTTESGNAIKTESSSENKTESDSNNSDESTKKSASSILSATEKILHKTEHPQNFENILKDEVKKEVTLNQKVNIENEIDKNQRFVKSSEIIKELSKFITRQEKGSLSFDIKPESLGKMKITLDTIDHAVKASIEVDNEQAKQLVERNINKLQQELQSNGIQLSSLNISLGQPKNHKGEKQTSGSNKNNDSNFENDEIEITEEKKKTLGYNTYEYIA